MILPQYFYKEESDGWVRDKNKNRICSSMLQILE
jgi:hypothetical protein